MGRKKNTKASFDDDGDGDDDGGLDGKGILGRLSGLRGLDSDDDDDNGVHSGFSMLSSKKKKDKRKNAAEKEEPPPPAKSAGTGFGAFSGMNDSDNSASDDDDDDDEKSDEEFLNTMKPVAKKKSKSSAQPSAKPASKPANEDKDSKNKKSSSDSKKPAPVSSEEAKGKQETGSSSASQNKDSNKKKGKKNEKVEESTPSSNIGFLDDILEEDKQNAPPLPPPASFSTTSSAPASKEKKGKKGAKKTEPDASGNAASLDDLLADLDISSTSSVSSVPVGKDSSGVSTSTAAVEIDSKTAELVEDKGDDEARDDDDDDDDDDDGKTGLSAAERKKLKKKQKKKQKKSEKSEEPEESSKSDSAGPKKGSRAAMLRDLLQAKKAEEERVRREEEEAERIRIEEEKRLLEEARLREEERAKKREEERKRKEILRKQGRLLSKTQEAQRARDRAAVEQLAKLGMIVPGLQESTHEKSAGESLEKKKKAVDLSNAAAFRKKKSAAGKRQHEPQWLLEQLEKEKNREQNSQEQQSSVSYAEEVLDSWEDALASSGDEESKDDEKTTVESHSSRKAVKSVSRPDNKSSETAQPADEDESSPNYRTAGDIQQSKGMRSPICVVLGHVDTGKTKLLDKIRQTSVQENEAGGITQQIGATYFPEEILVEKIAVADPNVHVNVPGLLIIDTPGHESFNNLRSRGTGLCDIAILVVDIMHGLEAQTLESLELLRMRKTPFIVALNKIDRMYGWEEKSFRSSRDAIAVQKKHVQEEFNKRVTDTITLFAERGLNARLYWDNTDFRKYVSLVPTSAITGEGIPDLLMLMVSLTQTHLSENLLFLSELQCTILEVKVIEGLGTTIDVILSNGELHEGDTIVVCGLDGPIVTSIRALLTPRPMREIRVKGEYIHHKRIQAAQGIKIAAPDLDGALPGSSLLVVKDGDDVEALKEEVMSDLHSIIEDVDRSGKGVYVQSSTLGSLEALLQFLKHSNIPVFNINIGPVYRKDVMKASIMLEQAPEYAVILAFDVRITPEGQAEADELGVKIFSANIIYHLFDQFTAYMQDVQNRIMEEAKAAVVFPAQIKILDGMVFNMRDPIIVGVEVVKGFLKVGTPLCAIEEGGVAIPIGTVASIEENRKSMDEAKKGKQVAIRIDTPPGRPPRQVDKHFSAKSPIVSRITRKAIDLLKENFRDVLSKEDWKLVAELKKVLSIE